jgi:hypothetical protein
MASPSSPSVRFTAFEDPTMTRSVNGIQSQPICSSQPLRNGITRAVVNPSGGRK